MKIDLEVDNVHTDDGPRLSVARLPLRLNLSVYETGNKHQVTLVLSKRLALKIIEQLSEEIRIWS